MKGKLYCKDGNTFVGNIGEYAGKKNGVKYYVGDIVKTLVTDTNIIVKYGENNICSHGYNGGELGLVKEKIRSYNDLKDKEIINGVKVVLETDEEDTDVLKVDLHSYENLVFGKILYQNTNILKRGDFKYIASNGCIVKSINQPDLCFNTLYIVGLNVMYTDMTIFHPYASPKQAEEYLNKIQQAVKELNEKYSKPQIKKESYDTFLYSQPIHVDIEGIETTVTLKNNNIKGSVICDDKDKYDKQEGIVRAYKKALINKKKSEIKQLKSEIYK